MAVCAQGRSGCHRRRLSLPAVPRPLTLLALFCATAALAACGSDSTSQDTTGSTAAADTSTAAATTTPTTTRAAAPNGGCTTVAEPKPKGEQSLPKPTLKLDPAKTWTADVTTNCGDFTITLAAGPAPRTSASFASLSEQGFYDGLTFHRIVSGFVVQGGDPLGTGQGGPGYSVVETPPSSLKYTRGVVAMAKTGAEAPGTSGSQFFIVTAPDAGLPPEYALAGRVTKGQPVVDRIGATPVDPQTEQPLSPVVIKKVTIHSS